MTKPLVIEGAAHEELRDAVAWYEENQVGLGSQFFDEVLQTLDLIESHPGLGAQVPHVAPDFEVRRLPLRRFPYSIVYRERETRLQIIALTHQSRKPGYWSSR